MRPILFLDFDGVFLTHRGAMAQVPESVRFLPNLPGARMMLDMTALGLVAHAVKETNAFIVISSTWRRGGREDCTAFLELVGIENHLHPEWRTALNDKDRGHQILDWLMENRIDPSTPIAALDDDSDDIVGFIGDRLVLTDSNEGMGFQNTLDLIEMLQTPIEDSKQFWPKR